MLFKIVSAESGFVFMSFSAISICSLVEACLSHATSITTETDMIMILLARNEIIYVVFFPPISARTILMAAKNADNLDFLYLNIVFYIKFTFIFCSINKGWGTSIQEPRQHKGNACPWLSWHGIQNYESRICLPFVPE